MPNQYKDDPVFSVPPRYGEDDCVVLGLDPGDEHVGLALANRTNPLINPPGWKVRATGEMTPRQFVRWFRANSAGIDLLIGEAFRLDVKKAKTLIGSDMPTSRLIGWVRVYCEYEAPHMSVLWQPNTILTGPTTAILRDELHVRPVSPPGKNASRGSTGDHQRSAELHLWHGLIRSGVVPGVLV